MHTKAKGNIAEDRACEYLRSRGFRIIDRNVYNRFGEIDIIALKDSVLHFVEVKSGNAFLMDKQKNIKTAILEKRVHWHEISIAGNTED